MAPLRVKLSAAVVIVLSDSSVLGPASELLPLRLLNHIACHTRIVWPAASPLATKSG